MFTEAADRGMHERPVFNNVVAGRRSVFSENIWGTSEVRKTGVNHQGRRMIGVMIWHITHSCMICDRPHVRSSPGPGGRMKMADVKWADRTDGTREIWFHMLSKFTCWQRLKVVPVLLGGSIRGIIHFCALGETLRRESAWQVVIWGVIKSRS